MTISKNKYILLFDPGSRYMLHRHQCKFKQCPHYLKDLAILSKPLYNWTKTGWIERLREHYTIRELQNVTAFCWKNFLHFWHFAIISPGPLWGGFKRTLWICPPSKFLPLMTEPCQIKINLLSLPVYFGSTVAPNYANLYVWRFRDHIRCATMLTLKYIKNLFFYAFD